MWFAFVPIMGQSKQLPSDCESRNRLDDCSVIGFLKRSIKWIDLCAKIILTRYTLFYVMLHCSAYSYQTIKLCRVQSRLSSGHIAQIHMLLIPRRTQFAPQGLLLSAADLATRLAAWSWYTTTPACADGITEQASIVTSKITNVVLFIPKLRLTEFSSK